MKKLRQMVSLVIVSCVLCGSMVHAKEADISAEENLLYEKMLEAYLNGEAMEEWAVEARKQIAKELELSEYLDDRSFLSIEYRNENLIGRDGEITDPKLNLLVEMATNEEVDAILMKSQIQMFQARAITSGQSVGVTQMARVSGAGNGYFTVSGANSYGYCALNHSSFWSNGVTKYGTAYEWDNAEARKALYYGPGGPGYAGPYYGSLGADMDYTTFAIGQLNGDTYNNTKANAYRSFLSSKADPISSGYRAYKADIASPYQDVAFLSYSPVTTTLTIEKRSQTDLYSGDGYKYLSGVVFDLYSFNGSTFNTLVSTAADNGNGSYTFHNVPTSSYNGMYLVKERAAKAGYQNRYYLNDIYDETDYNVWGGRVFQLNTSNNTWSCASLGHFPYPGWGFTFLDYPNNVTVTITKKDSETGEKLTGAAFELWAYRGDSVASDSGNPAYSYRVGDFTDNQDGTYSITFPFDLATFNGSAYWFMYKETKAPDGYEKDAWAASGYGICFDANGNGTTEFVVENKPFPKSNLVICKQNEKGKELEGAEFALYEDEAGTTCLQTGVSDENGKVEFTGLISGRKYYLKETKAPTGYRVPVDEDGNPVMTELQVCYNPSSKEYTLYVDGNEYDFDSEGTFTFTGTEESPEITMTAINETGYLLPQTGSSFALISALAAVLLLVRSTKVKTGKEGKKE